MAANGVMLENSRRGAPETDWDVNGPGDPTLQGFATEMSVNHGSPVSFKVKTDATAYRIDIYRIGYYDGLGARLVASVKPSVKLPLIQPDCLKEASTRLCDCGNWSVTATWDVPSDAQSGVYVARLVRTDRRRDPGEERPPALPHAYGALGHGRLANPLRQRRASHIVFVVRADESQADIVFQTSDLAWQAANRFGGSSLDGGFIGGKELGLDHRAYKVSYNRPLVSRIGDATNQFFHAEYPMVRWLEANGYDVTYIAGVDSTRFGDKLKHHKVFLTCGLDSFWTGAQRRHIEAARNSGVHLAFFSGSTGMWRARWESSLDASHAAYRTLVCYKETHSRIDHHGEYQTGAKLDPQTDEWTGTFRDPAPFNPVGAQPENSLTGTMSAARGLRHDVIEVPAAHGKHRFWRHTSVSRLEAGESALLEGASLGPQWDEDQENGFRPAGLQHLSETTVDNVARLQDFGSIADGGTATHHLTLYRASSGALVFSAGTAQWSWGLDAHHNNVEGNPLHDETIRIGVDPRAPDGRVQQATVNLLADMGIRASNLRPGLVQATQSSEVDP